MAVDFGDQKLVKVGRPRKNVPAPKNTSLDDVAARYHTPYDDVPTSKDPLERRHPTISLIELTADARDVPPTLSADATDEALLDTSDGKLRTLEDLMGKFPFDGTGQYFVHVTRRMPRTFASAATFGVQQYIKSRITLDEFYDTYGGGEYELIVYGPPKRGGHTDDHGNMVPKALTNPIRFTVPWVGDYAIPPNPESMAGIGSEDLDEDNMHGNGGRPDPAAFRSRGIATPATAKIHETSTLAQERREERDRAERRETVERQSREERTALDVVKEQAATTTEILQAQLAETQAELRELRNREPQQVVQPPAVTLEGVASLLGTMQPKSEPDEIRRMRDSHKEELTRLAAQHQQTIEAMRARHSEEITSVRTAERESTDRAQRRAEEAEREATRKVSDTETRCREREDRAKDDARKDLDRADKDYTRSLDALRRDHDREIQSLKNTHEQLLAVERGSYARSVESTKEISDSRVATEKTVLQGKLDTLSSELGRASAEVVSLKSELAKKGSIAKQLGEFESVASSLGFTRGGGEGGEAPEVDWKTLVLTGGVELVKNLPNILASAAQAAQAARGGSPPEQMPRRMMSAPPGAPPLSMPSPAQMPWQSEETLHREPLPESMQRPYSGVPVMPQAGPAMEGPFQSEPAIEQGNQFQGYPPQGMQPVTESMPPGHMMMAPATSMPSMPPVPQARQRRAERRSAQQAPAAGAVEVQISDEQLRAFQGDLESALQQGVPPETVAQGVFAMHGKKAAVVANQLSPEGVADALVRIGQSGSPLTRREGQKFLVALQAELRRLSQ